MIGIFGGTFDPVHYGHLRPAQEILRALSLQKLYLVPASTPPHRQSSAVDAVQRLQMTQLATTEFPELIVDDCEIQRGGISYTVDTLQTYRQHYPQTPMCLLMGSDVFASLESWHQWQRIPELAHLVVMQRPQYKTGAIPQWSEDRLTQEISELSTTLAGKVYLHTVTPQDISATAIRQDLKKHEDVTHMLPAPVLQYIQQHHLYE